MSSSKDNDTKKVDTEKVDREKVQILIERFLDVIEGTLNTVDQIAHLNTETVNGVKYIKAAKFRLNIRHLKVKLLEDLKLDKKL